MSDGKTEDAASFGDVLRSLREIRRLAMSVEGDEMVKLHKSLQGVVDRRRRSEEKRLAKQEAAVRNAARRKRPSAFAEETGPTGRETAEFWEDAHERVRGMRQHVIEEQRELQADLDKVDEQLQVLGQVSRMLR